MDLVTFLLARISEDEEAAKDAALTVGWDGFGDQRIRSGQYWVPSYHVVKRVRDEGPTDRREVADCGALFGISTAAHIARWDPARVLAECEAKRRIVAEHPIYRGPRILIVDTSGTDYGCELCHCIDPIRVDGIIEANGYCETLRLLALPYADHPDFQPEWRPEETAHQ